MESETIVHGLRRNVFDLSDNVFSLTAWNSEPNATQSDPSFLKPNPFFQSCNWIKCSILAHPGNPWIICQSVHTLETHQYSMPIIKHPDKPMNHMPILAHPGNPSIQFFIKHPVKSNSLVQSSQTLSISLSLEEFFIVIQTSCCPASSKKNTSIHWSTDPSLSTDDLNNFRPISNLNFISRMLKKASHIQSHLSSNSFFFPICFTGSFILLKLLFLKFTMTSSLRWIVVRSLAFFLTYLQPLISVDHSILLDHPSSILVWFWWYFT